MSVFYKLFFLLVFVVVMTACGDSNVNNNNNVEPHSKIDSNENEKGAAAGLQEYSGKLMSFERMEYEDHRIKFEDGKTFKINQEANELIDIAEASIGKKIKLSYEMLSLEEPADFFFEGETIPKSANTRIVNYTLKSFEFELGYEGESDLLLTLENGKEEHLQNLKYGPIEKIKSKFATQVIDKRTNGRGPDRFLINFEKPIILKLLYRKYQVEDVKKIEIAS